MSRRVVYRTLNFGKGTIPANTPLFKISDTKGVDNSTLTLQELNNVDITTPTDGQALVYDNGIWKNQTVLGNLNIDGGNASSIPVNINIDGGGA